MNTKMIWLAAPALVAISACGSSQPEASEPGQVGAPGVGQFDQYNRNDGEGSFPAEAGGLDADSDDAAGADSGTISPAAGMEGGPAQLPGTVPTTQPAPVPPGGAAPPGGTVPMSPGAGGTKPTGTTTPGAIGRAP